MATMMKLPAKKTHPNPDVQPISWGRAFFVGVFGAILLMFWIDCFNMAGYTPLSLERYVGTLILDHQWGTSPWTVGFFANLFIGGLFGILYGYFFEYYFERANPRTGLVASLAHLVIAAVAFFPFFNIIHDEMGIHMYPSFGILGIGMGLGTFTILVVGHFLFGMAMGTLYGPVREERVRAQSFETGDTGEPGEPGTITEAYDPSDRMERRYIY